VRHVSNIHFITAISNEACNSRGKFLESRFVDKCTSRTCTKRNVQVKKKNKSNKNNSKVQPYRSMLTRSKPVGTEIALTRVTLQTRETESESPLTNRTLRTSIGLYKNLEITSTSSTGRSLKEGDIFTRVKYKVKLRLCKREE